MIDLSWADFKAHRDLKGLDIQEFEFSNKYVLYLFDGPLEGVCKIKKSTSDATDYEDNYKSFSNRKLDKKDSSGITLASQMKPSGLSDGSLVSPDFCDKTTWYEKATDHTGITLSNTTGNIYKHTDYPYWIDLTHGKRYSEDALANQMEPVIYDNAVEVTDGFTIDYTTGEVTFDSAPTGPVTADFWKAGSSEFSLVPDAGKVLMLEHAELQFSKDIDMNSPITFQIWVYNPADLPNKVPYKTIRYKNIKDIINTANLGQGFIPAISGLANDVVIFPFNYVGMIPLASAVGAELRICIDSHEPFPGEWATATFYFISEDE